MLNGLLNPLLTKRAAKPSFAPIKPNMWDKFYSGYNKFLGGDSMKALTQGLEHKGRDSGWQTAGKMLINGVNTINPMRYVGRAAQDANAGNWKGYAANAGSALFGAGTMGGGSTMGFGRGLLSKAAPTMAKALPSQANRFATYAELGSIGGAAGGFLPGKGVPGQPYLRNINPNDLMA